MSEASAADVGGWVTATSIYQQLVHKAESTDPGLREATVRTATQEYEAKIAML